MPSLTHPPRSSLSVSAKPADPPHARASAQRHSQKVQSGKDRREIRKRRRWNYGISYVGKALKHQRCQPGTLSRNDAVEMDDGVWKTQRRRVRRGERSSAYKTVGAGSPRRFLPLRSLRLCVSAFKKNAEQIRTAPSLPRSAKLPGIARTPLRMALRARRIHAEGRMRYDRAARN